MVDVIVESSIASAFTPLAAEQHLTNAALTNESTLVAAPTTTITALSDVDSSVPISSGLAIDSKRIGDANPSIQKSHTAAEFKFMKKKRQRAKSTKLANERNDQGFCLII